MFESEAQKLERWLRQREAAGLIPLEMAGEFVLPEYAGHSLANVAGTLGQLLCNPLPQCAPPLDAIYWRGLAEGTRRVVLVLLDEVHRHIAVRELAPQQVARHRKARVLDSAGFVTELRQTRRRKVRRARRPSAGSDPILSQQELQDWLTLFTGPARH